MIIFVGGGSKFAKGGPNPLANMDSRGSISASGFGPGGPNPRGSKSARTPAVLSQGLVRPAPMMSSRNDTLCINQLSYVL